MKCFKVSIFMLVGIIFASIPAFSYKAEVGTRAANFSGFDIVNREVVELDDFVGKWVFIEFWASW